jgi:hypothetical protein
MNFDAKRIREARKRCDAATAGPWEYDGMHNEITTPRGDAYWLIISECRSAPDQEYTRLRDGHQFDANFALIAAARTDLPDALDDLEAWRALAERAAEHIRNCDLPLWCDGGTPYKTCTCGRYEILAALDAALEGQ